MRMRSLYGIGLVVLPLWAGAFGAESDPSGNGGKEAGSAGMRAILPAIDTTSVMRNPACGWALYSDGPRYNDAHGDWQQVDAGFKDFEPYISRASIFYIRAIWSDFEPEEGTYVWTDNADFNRLLHHVRDHGLKLAFRVVVDSEYSAIQATPAYVKIAGAKGHAAHGRNALPLWNPDLDDPIFQEKFARFIAAFAARFDDPDTVDFIDGSGLGYAGEMNHTFLAKDRCEPVFAWLCAAYGSAFKRVLLTMNIGEDFDLALDDSIAFRRHGFIARRDGLGSEWFSREQKKFLLERFPSVPLMAECCYSTVKTWTEPWMGKAGITDYREILSWSLKDALDHHANTLDLRFPIDAKTWVEDAPDLVQRFISEGGYRLAPTEIRLPDAVKAGATFTIRHTWQNAGVGVLPNANPRWQRKYRIAFALFPKGEAAPRAVQIVPNADPGDWVRGKPMSYDTVFTWPAGVSGTCDLGLAIVDTTCGNRPALRLAVADLPIRDGWLMIARLP
jgi:hypothetical protein